MSLLDDLISQIPDLALRTRLKKAVDELRRRQKFGLVFEEHVPETTAILGFPLVPDSVVQNRQEGDEAPLGRLVRVLYDKKSAVVMGGDNKERTIPTKDLLTVKRFGEPMFAALEPRGHLDRGPTDRPHHAVINGENYHALQLFTFLFEKSVDCIYIDPPYNTGARDWKYNNRFVDINDVWRHSKWLAMMEKRLRIARRLLKPDGAIVVMIDEHERHHLGMLLERVFPEYGHHMISIVINARGSTGNRDFGSIEEQALFAVPSTGQDVIQPRESFIPDFKPKGSETEDLERLLAAVARTCPDLLEQLRETGAEFDDDDVDTWRDLAETEIDQDADDEDSGEGGSDVEEEGEQDRENPAAYWHHAHRTGQGTSFRTQRKNQFYPLYIDPKDPGKIEVGEPLLEMDRSGHLRQPSWETVDGLVPIWPVDEEGAERVWCYEPGRMREEVAKGNIRIGRYNPKRKTYAVDVRRVRRTRQRFRERTIWWERAYDAGSNGTNVLKKLLGTSGLFPFPKSIYAVRDVLATVVGSRPNALVVDFFAGSGTTLHSTCLLNQVDGGSRRCILVTNNEVDEESTKQLASRGKFRGDPEFESMGIYKRVTAPRVRAAVTGERADGSKVPGRYKWSGNKPMSDGFPENVEFYDLVYLDPDDVDLGTQFKAIHPLLWMASGAVGERAEADDRADFLIAPSSPYAILFRPSRLRKFLEKLGKRTDVTHVWIVTDSETAYAEVCESLPRSVRRTGQLYSDYLRTFRINGGAST